MRPEQACRRRRETLDHQFVALSQEKFEDAVGISLSEAQSLRSRCEELTARAAQAEKNNAELQIALVKQQTVIGELEASEGEGDGGGGGAVNHEVVSKALNDNAVLLKSFRDLEERLHQKTEAELSEAHVKDLQLLSRAICNRATEVTMETHEPRGRTPSSSKGHSHH